MPDDALAKTTDALIRLALAEDGVSEDVTSRSAVPETATGQARLVARTQGVFCGAFLLAPAPAFAEAFPGLRFTSTLKDGDALEPGQVLAEIAGPARELLGLERTLLNFLQRLGGIATTTAHFVAAAGPKTRIQETRKTCPGWRHLDKHAVAAGGGLNHRMGLHDQVLLKENHLVFSEDVPQDPRAIERAVAACRQKSPGVTVEVEVETVAQFEAAMRSGADIIMLDDFDDAGVADAVARRAASGSKALLEVSGSVRLDRVARLAEFGVDRISVGALTHSVPALDLAIEIEMDRASA